MIRGHNGRSQIRRTLQGDSNPRDASVFDAMTLLGAGDERGEIERDEGIGGAVVNEVNRAASVASEYDLMSIADSLLVVAAAPVERCRGEIFVSPAFPGRRQARMSTPSDVAKVEPDGRNECDTLPFRSTVLVRGFPRVSRTIQV